MLESIISDTLQHWCLVKLFYQATKCLYLILDKIVLLLFARYIDLTQLNQNVITIKYRYWIQSTVNVFYLFTHSLTLFIYKILQILFWWKLKYTAAVQKFRSQPSLKPPHIQNFTPWKHNGRREFKIPYRRSVLKWV